MKAKAIYIYGNVEEAYYDDTKSDVSPEIRIRKKYRNGRVYFNIRFMPEIDIVKEIEEHSPIKVTVKK